MSEDMLADLIAGRQEPKGEDEYPSCPFLRENAPLLHDFLRFDSYLGKPRTPGRLAFTADGNLFVLSITDKDYERSFSVMGYNLAECLATIEQCIATRQVHWRYWGKNGSAAGRTRRAGRK